VRGDISDLATVQRATESISPVYIYIHISPPVPGSQTDVRIMDVEKNALQNLIRACNIHNARRVLYRLSPAIAPNEARELLRERWNADQLRLDNSLDQLSSTPVLSSR
jgi:3-beta hydroxysteroid dehydrogenase/isomerase family